MNLINRRLFCCTVVLSTYAMLGITACGVISIEEIPASTATPFAQLAANLTATFTPYPTYAEPTMTATLTLTPTLDPAAPLATPSVLGAATTQAKIEQADDVPFLLDQLIHDYREPQPDLPLALKPYTLHESEVIWDNWWCAVGDALLTESLTQVSFHYSINEQPLDPSQAYIYQRKMSWGSTCQVTAFYLSGWAAGTHKLTYTYTLAKPFNDGLKDYPAGNYTTIFEIHVDNPLPAPTPSQ